MYVQAILTVVMVTRDKFEFPQFHTYFGFVDVIALAIIYVYRTQVKDQTYMLYVFGSVFIVGFGIGRSWWDRSENAISVDLA